MNSASHAPVIFPISSIITLVCGIVLCDIPCRLSMTSSLRRFFGAAYACFGIAATIFARTSSPALRSVSGFGVSPFAGITTSHRIGRVFENAVKLIP